MNFRIVLLFVVFLIACGPAPQPGTGGGAGGASGGGGGATSQGRVQASWTLNGSTASPAARCADAEIAFWTLRATRADGGDAFDLSVDCVNGAWQAEARLVSAGAWTVVLEAHAAPAFSGSLVASVTREVTVLAGDGVTPVSLDLAVGAVELSWTIDGRASGAATVCPAEGVTFWVARLGERSVSVSCANGRWATSFKAVPAGSAVARVEAHQGAPSTGPLKLAKEGQVTVAPGSTQTVTIDFSSSEL